MSHNNASHFVLQLGSLITLFITLGFFLALLFSLITLQFPAVQDVVWEIENAKGMLRVSFAMVVVFFPAYLVLTRTVNKLRREEQAAYSGITKWLIYLALLIGGLVLLGDLVAVIISYLEGDITIRFIMKALAVLLVVGSAFLYYLLDARGYWLTREKWSVWYGGAVTALILLGLGVSLMRIDSPATVREQRLDQNQIADLQTIQWYVQDYISANNAVPASLDELTVPRLPTAPEGRPAYRYEPTATGFALCATFSTASDQQYPSAPVDRLAIIRNPDNWQYEPGETCFERVVQLPEAVTEE